jgi:hypothetical protein
MDFGILAPDSVAIKNVIIRRIVDRSGPNTNKNIGAGIATPENLLRFGKAADKIWACELKIISLLASLFPRCENNSIKSSTLNSMFETIEYSSTDLSLVKESKNTPWSSLTPRKSLKNAETAIKTEDKSASEIVERGLLKLNLESICIKA